MSLFDMTGKVAIVTGASRGIGEAIARALADAGAKVVVASRKIDGVTAVAQSIGAAAHPVAANTGKEAECAQLVEAAIAKFGKVDVLVNNAGTNLHFGPLLGIEEGAWDKTFQVNLKGYFWMIRAVANHLTSRGAPGSIVNMASVTGVEAAPLQGLYGATKAAVISLTKTLAFELGPSNIRVNAICPGLIETKFASVMTQNPDMLRMITAKTPLGRHGQPSEIAGGALYLASDAASFLTGHSLVIDGGMTIC
jgi:NAD(P)-dependent dehydrogenase (short-subunit alcohol dehydrogenase family)